MTQDASDLAELLLSTLPEDRASIFDALEASIDRQILALVAEHGFFQTEGPWKDAAMRFFVRSAPLYFPNLSPTFHVIPWAGDQLLSSSDFADVYGRAADRFTHISADLISRVLRDAPKTLVVFRMIAAFSRNQISFVLRTMFDSDLSGDELRLIERLGNAARPATIAKWRAMSDSLGQLLYAGVTGELMPDPHGIDLEKFKRLTDKVDTLRGWESVAEVAEHGVSYDALLYQRYVGGTFGQAVNASTSLKADLLEDPVEKLLRDNHIPFYRVAARERIPGWTQAPDFLIPDRERPELVIEAKVAEDGGTARDKASRIERLARAAHDKGVTTVAVVDGLGFFRVNDVLAPILANTQGRVYSAANLTEMLEAPQLVSWKGRARPS